MRIELHPDADAEFAAGIDYYNERLPGLGNRFYREVMSRLEWILENPLLARERSGYRRVNLRFFPNYIAYHCEGDKISVVAIGHGNREPEYWKSRLTKG